MARTNLAISPEILDQFRTLKEEILIHDREIGMPTTNELMVVLVESGMLHLPETIRAIRNKRGK